jgi:hypothetical protein
VDEVLFKQQLNYWLSVLPSLNAPLEAWGKQEIDINAPDWMDRLEQAKSPLDDSAELREHFNTVTREVAEVYQTGTDEQRAMIRSLLKQMKGVRYFLGVHSELIRSQNDATLFRLALIFESMCDLRNDSRDVIITLIELCKAGQRAGIEVVRYLEEIAAISSDVDHHTMDSMRDLLRRQISVLVKHQ